MDDRIRALKSDIQAELAAIARLFEALPGEGADLSHPRDAIVVGYYLHNLYNAFEAIFRLVAEAFENHVPDTTRWHSLLLERMGRQIEALRPPLLSPAAVAALDELRRFRHLFRHLYHGDLTAEGLATTLAQADRLRAVYGEDIGGFMGFLDRLAETSPDSCS